MPFQLQCKEEGLNRRTLDIDNHSHIMMEFQKHAYPLTYLHTDLISIINRKVADNINVADFVLIGEKMKQDFMKSLLDGFYSSIKGRIKNMEAMKGGSKLV